MTKSTHHKSANDKPLYLGMLTLALLVLVAGLVYLHNLKARPISSAPAQPLTTIIARAQVSSSVDNTGRAATLTQNFPAKSKLVYITVELASAKPNDTISYIRYKDGTYINAGTVRVASTATKNVALAFNNPQGYPAGNYQVVLYKGQKPVRILDYSVQ